MKKVYIVLIVAIIIILVVGIYLFKINNKNPYNYKNPIIPEGFKKVETKTASWDLENGVIKGWNEGLVIEDEKGNQFVWVPVDIKNLKYSDYYKENYKTFNEGSLDKNDIEDNQIIKYGGFYIARYEAGVSDEMNNVLNDINEKSNDILGIPASKKDVRPWNFISLKNVKKNSMSMYNNKFVNSDLMSEKQWVTIMQWIKTVDYSVFEDSSEFGNYSNVNFKFTGLYSIDYGKNYKYGENVNKSQYNMILSSGSTDRNMVKNIYDLAGNLLEYIDEYTTNAGGGYYCVGGHFDNTGGYKIDTMALIETKPLDKIGFRIVLYNK